MPSTVRRRPTATIDLESLESRNLLAAFGTPWPEPRDLTISFPADDALLVSIAELVTLERRCCPFLDFNIELRPAAEKLSLHLSGGAGVKDFLRQELSGIFAGM